MANLLYLGIAILFFLGGFIGYVLKRLSVFEIKEWRKRSREKKNWLNEVERTANGIQRAWHYSGFRPKEEDRERTAEQMDEFIDDLKGYKTHQNVTDEMVEVMNEIIERWEKRRNLILTSNRTREYHRWEQRLSDNSEELKRLLNKERHGRVRRTFSNVSKKIRSVVERVRRWGYERQSNQITYGIYRELQAHLSKNDISEFVDGDCFLCITREYSTDAIFYEKDEGRYNVFQIDYDSDGEIVVIDKLSGGTLTEDMLLDRLGEAEGLDIIPYGDIIPEGQSLKEFEESDVS